MKQAFGDPRRISVAKPDEAGLISLSRLLGNDSWLGVRGICMGVSQLAAVCEAAPSRTR